MPTACVEPSVFGPRAQSLDELTGVWWVAQTRPQYERSLAHELAAEGHGYYLPAVDLIVVRAGKRRRERRLALPGYLFLNGDAEARYVAARSRCTAQIINVVDQARFLREISRLQHSIIDSPVYDTTAFLKLGVKCRVRMGHRLEGLEGWVDVVTGRGTVTVSITLLGSGTPLEIDPCWLEPTEG